jgi:hypothetical protein
MPDAPAYNQRLFSGAAGTCPHVDPVSISIFDLQPIVDSQWLLRVNGAEAAANEDTVRITGCA